MIIIPNYIIQSSDIFALKDREGSITQPKTSNKITTHNILLKLNLDKRSEQALREYTSTTSERLTYFLLFRIV